MVRLPGIEPGPPGWRPGALPQSYNREVTLGADSRNRTGLLLGGSQTLYRLSYARAEPSMGVAPTASCLPSTRPAPGAPTAKKSPPARGASGVGAPRAARSGLGGGPHRNSLPVGGGSASDPPRKEWSRRDSHPQPPVGQTGALLLELRPLGNSVERPGVEPGSPACDTGVLPIGRSSQRKLCRPTRNRTSASGFGVQLATMTSDL
jgi:hypothetical protein